MSDTNVDKAAKKPGCLCRLIKYTFFAGLALVLLVLALLLAFPLWFGPLATSVANSSVPGITGTEFNLDGVSLNPYSGKFRISELHLNNPKGYDTIEAFGLKSLKIDIKTGELFDNMVHITDLDIDGVFVSYIDSNGTNNFDAIIANVMSNLKLDEEKEEEEEEVKKEKEPMKFLIDHLRVANVSVKYGMLPAIPLPTIELRDIGKDKEGGMTLDELVKTLTDAFTKASQSLLKGVGALGGLLDSGAAGALNLATGLLGGDTSATNAAEAVGSLLKQTGNITGNATEKLGALTKGAGDGAGAAVKSASDATGSAVKGASDAAGSAVKGASDAAAATGDAIKKGADSVTEGAKNLFKGIGFGK